MGVAIALGAHHAVIGVLGGELGLVNGEGRSLFHAAFHAAENEVDAEAVGFLAGFAGGGQPILFADALLGPEDGDAILDAIVLDPALVMVGRLAQKFLGANRFAPNLAEEVAEVGLAGQEGQIAVDADAIEAMIKPLQERPEKQRRPGRKAAR